jgi:coatomer protein complex subunit gamma
MNEIVVRWPYVVAPCRADLEHLITDSNRTIATLAITALLKV